MAKLVLASAQIVDRIQPDQWLKTIEKHPGKIVRASSKKIPLSEYPPDQYLFSHSCIVSSVDHDSRIPYYITPETAHLVNANGDAWTRGVISGTYQTFIGAPNFHEHVQVMSLRKGWILDATVREVPNSLYVDILVATDRKHKELVASIESGLMKTMSMGALVQYTTCTRCGNISKSEDDSCICIRAMKGQTFIDPFGTRRIIAELCGDAQDLQSNRFIEASWVKDPAFKGAITRALLNPSKELLARLSLLEKQGKIIDYGSAKKKVAYQLFTEGPQFGVMYSPPFLVEIQQKPKNEEEHSVETATPRKKIPQDAELAPNFSVFTGNKVPVEFDNLFLTIFKQGNIRFRDVLDFTNFYEGFFGRRTASELNELVKRCLNNKVIER
jgi:hypothetical protein